MDLYFKNSKGKMRKIAKIDGSKSTKEIMAEVQSTINNFCSERNFKIYYTRIWNTTHGEKPMTKFDVGSHTEFFYLSPAIPLTDVTNSTEECL